MNRLRRRPLRRIGCVVAVGIGVAGTARADERLGIGLGVGAGVEGFLGHTMRDAARPGASWDVRLEADPRMPVSLEVAYIGTAAAVTSPMLGQRGTLLGSTIEVDARASWMGGGRWRPYAFLGAGWRRYTVTGDQFDLGAMGMKDGDDLITYPMGFGVGYHAGVITIDGRVTVRPTGSTHFAWDDPQAATPSYASMDTWALTARLAVEL